MRIPAQITWQHFLCDSPYMLRQTTPNFGKFSNFNSWKYWGLFVPSWNLQNVYCWIGRNSSHIHRCLWTK